MDLKVIYKKEEKISLINVIFGVPSLLFIATAAVLTNTLIIWIDLIRQLSDLVTYLFTVVIYKSLKKDIKYKYNYGNGKIEAISSMFCNLVFIMCLLTIIVASIFNIVHPVKPNKLIFFVILFKSIAVLFGIRMAFLQNRYAKASRSYLVRHHLLNCLRNLSFNTFTLIALFVCHFFRNYRFTWYFIPSFSILISLYFIYQSIKRIKRSIIILTDKSLSEAKQRIIMNALELYKEDYKRFRSLKSHKTGHLSIIDLALIFDDDVTYEHIRNLKKKLHAKISEDINNAVVNIIIK